MTQTGDLACCSGVIPVCITPASLRSDCPVCSGLRVQVPWNTHRLPRLDIGETRRVRPPSPRFKPLLPQYMYLCIILYMINTDALRAEALSIADKAHSAKITQNNIAMAIGASQPQVSRILSGHLSRPSKLFQEICIYVRSATDGVTTSSVRENDELIEAVAATWDGTAQHAAALAAVIRSLGALHQQECNPAKIPANRSRKGNRDAVS